MGPFFFNRMLNRKKAGREGEEAAARHQTDDTALPSEERELKSPVEETLAIESSERYSTDDEVDGALSHKDVYDDKTDEMVKSDTFPSIIPRPQTMHALHNLQYGLSDKLGGGVVIRPPAGKGLGAFDTPRLGSGDFGGVSRGEFLRNEHSGLDYMFANHRNLSIEGTDPATAVGTCHINHERTGKLQNVVVEHIDGLQDLLVASEGIALGDTASQDTASRFDSSSSSRRHRSAAVPVTAHSCLGQLDEMQRPPPATGALLEQAEGTETEAAITPSLLPTHLRHKPAVDSGRAGASHTEVADGTIPCWVQISPAGLVPIPLQQASEHQNDSEERGALLAESQCDESDRDESDSDDDLPLGILLNPSTRAASPEGPIAAQPQQLSTLSKRRRDPEAKQTGERKRQHQESDSDDDVPFGMLSTPDGTASFTPPGQTTCNQHEGTSVSFARGSSLSNRQSVAPRTRPRRAMAKRQGVNAREERERFSAMLEMTANTFSQRFA